MLWLSLIQSFLEFLASVIGSVLSWPVAALVIVLLLLKQIRNLIARVKTAKMFGSEVTIASEELLETVETETAAVVETTPAAGSVGIEADTAEIPRDGDRDPQNQEDGGRYPRNYEDRVADPSGAIIRAWTELEVVLMQLAELKGSILTRPTRSIGAVLSQLRENGEVSQAFLEAITGLRELRNRIAHGLFVPTQGAAITFIESARQLEMIARGMVAVERSQKGLALKKAQEDLGGRKPDETS